MRDTPFNFSSGFVYRADCLPNRLILPLNAVWIWEIAIPDDAVLARLAADLSGREQERARRFLIPQARSAFIAARAAMRAIVGRALGIEPAQIAIAIAPGGKPVLAGTLAARLSINLSHSGPAAMIAVGDGRRIGVDVECVRGDVDVAALERRYFGAAAQFDGVRGDAEARRGAFFRGWVQREAFLKAMGVGLSAPIDAITIAAGQGGAFTPAIAWPAAPDGHWRGHDLPFAGAEAAAAVCWDGPIEAIVLRQFSF